MNELVKLEPLIDADGIVYRCGLADKTQEEPVEYTLHTVKLFVEGLLANFDMKDGATLFLTGDGNFREQIATIKPYKGNRDLSKRPVYFKEIREYLVHKYNAQVVYGEEADDALAQAQWLRKDRGTVICTVDKDLLYGVPGWSFNYRNNKLCYTKKADADRFLFRQMLEGDTSDNIPGINRIGPKSVDKIFEELDYDIDRIRERVQQLYQKQYGSEWTGAYEEVGNLLWIRRERGQQCPLL